MLATVLDTQIFSIGAQFDFTHLFFTFYQPLPNCKINQMLNACLGSLVAISGPVCLGALLKSTEKLAEVIKNVPVRHELGERKQGLATPSVPPRRVNKERPRHRAASKSTRGLLRASIGKRRCNLTLGYLKVTTKLIKSS